MKILVISPQDVLPPIDGGKKSIYMPLKLLAEKHEVYFAFPFGNGDTQITKKYELDGINAIPLPVNPQDKFISALLNFAKPYPFKVQKYYDSLSLDKLLDTIKTEGIDCIWVNHYHMAPYALKIRERINIPCYLREHNIEFELVYQFNKVIKSIPLKLFTKWQYAKSKKFETKCWDTFDKTFFITKKDFVEAKKICPILEVKGDYIYDGVSLPEKTKDLKLREKAFVFSGSIKTFQNKYNLQDFVENYWIKAMNHIPEVKLYLTGNPEELLEQELGWDKTFLNNNRITNLGFIDNLDVFLQTKLFFVSPTILGAGLRIKVLHALSLSMITFVSMKDYEMCDYFVDGENLILYRSADEFIEKAKALLENLRMQEEISSNARETVKNHFNWQNYLRKTPFTK